MKIIINCFTIIFLNLNLNSQIFVPDETYLFNKKKGDSFYNAKDFKTAKYFYNLNIKSKYWNILDNFNFSKILFYNNDFSNSKRYLKYTFKGIIFYDSNKIKDNSFLKENMKFIQKAKLIYLQKIKKLEIFKYKAIQNELLKRVEKEQYFRKINYDTISNNEQKKILFKQAFETDSLNQIYLSSLIDKYGWMGFKEVGYLGDQSAWIIAQHTDFNKDLQNKFLASIFNAFKKGNTKLHNYGYIIDRVLVNNNQPQIFGTQMDVDIKKDTVLMKPKKLFSEYYVNTLRSYVNLSSIEDYIKLFTDHLMIKQEIKKDK